MNNQLVRAFICAFLYYIIFSVFVVVVINPIDPAYMFGYFLPSVVISAVVVGVIASRSKRQWSWRTMGIAEFVVFSIVIIIQLFAKFGGGS